MIFFGFVVLVATMLPARVAGQFMACYASGDYVQSSDDTLAFFNNIIPVELTFAQGEVGCLH